MEAEAPLPEAALSGAALDDLRALVERPGPFASVYLLLEPEEVDAPERLDVRWRHVRDALVEAGTPSEVVDAVDEAVQGASGHGGRTLVVLAPSAGDPFVAELALPARGELARWAPLPLLGPVLADRQAAVPHVVVRIDRTGADVVGVVGEEAVEEAEVEGDSYPIHRSSPGGWSQRRFQQRAESSWAENAAEVAEVVAAMAGRVDASFVAVAGDVRASTMLREALPPEVAAVVQEVRGSRHADGSDDLTDDEVLRLVATAGAATTTALLREASAELAREGRAVSGPDDVLAALAAGQVAVLLVHEDVDDDRAAWFGPEPMQVGATADVVQAMGVADPQRGRLLDVAVRAALGSGASIQVVPDAAHDAMAALLRWTI
ncbi:MAG TPA: Vms1/Ankzf1 family peptidyl-tRNA hydrolase [Aquihabitans sp.]|nr:Vms1/Ankzf1 family peptidyl-tRNA hydrolase [Aquihabitans sp.]